MPLSDGQLYHVYHGDAIPHMVTLPPRCMDCAIFSPPFPSLFSYTSLPEDIGNSEDLRGEAKFHLSAFFKQLTRVIKPGRVVVVHCTQIPGLARNGELGLFDFRGLLIRLGRRAGLIYQYDWLIRKNPQAQAIRTHSHNLLFVTLERDRAISRGALGDYLIKFIVPGTNAVPIDSADITREEWIDWAECTWTDIRETDTLNVAAGRGQEDVKHIAPLQLGVIERLVKLYTNPGEILFSPFAGIGSEGYVGLKLGRRFYGCEIKKEYYDANLKNLGRAVASRYSDQMSLLESLS